MSDMNSFEDLIDEFFDQARVVEEILTEGRHGDLVEEICYLAVALASVPGEERVLCRLDEYYDSILDLAPWIMDRQERNGTRGAA